MEAAPADKGALRVARADPDVLLCEELKQLYTALTRAKNNVIMFDSNMAKRAPFFNYLRRLGMAQYVSRSATALLAREIRGLNTCFHEQLGRHVFNAQHYVGCLLHVRFCVSRLAVATCSGLERSLHSAASLVCLHPISLSC